MPPGVHLPERPGPLASGSAPKEPPPKTAMAEGLGWKCLFASPYPVMRAVFWPGFTTDMAEWAMTSHERGKKENNVGRRAWRLPFNQIG